MTHVCVPAHLRCRFGKGSRELEALGRFLKNSCARGFRPSFQVEPDYSPRNPRHRGSQQPLTIPDTTIDEMCRGVFAMSADIALTYPRAMIRISIAVQDTVYKSLGDRYLTISGFPRLVNINELEHLRPRDLGRSVYPNDAPPPYSVGELKV